MANKSATTRQRARRTKKTGSLNRAAGLIEALKFISPAQRKAGDVQQQCCFIKNNWLVGFNGVLEIGVKIQEDLEACPHTFQFLDALQKTGDELNITQISKNILSVKSGDFRAIIACANEDEVTPLPPDPPQASITDEIAKAFKCMAFLASENAQSAYMAGVLLKSGSAVATNGHIIIEYWHGLHIPFEYILPKASAIAIANCEKQLVSIGFSNNSITFHYADESFIKTQIFEQSFPPYESLFQDVYLKSWPLPSEMFFQAVKAVEPFCKNGIVYFVNGTVTTSPIEDLATTYNIEGLPNDYAFSADYLLSLEKIIEKVYFDTLNGDPCLYFFKENIRGALMGIRLEPKKTPNVEEIDENMQDSSFQNSNDIPF